MKITLKIASVLTWFNLVFWGLITCVLLLAVLSSMYIPFLIVPVLMSAIPLNCYASLSLHKSIRRPSLPLSSQAPVGIRFVGFIALFFGISGFCSGFEVVGNAKDILVSVKEQFAQMKDMPQVQQQYKNLSVADIRNMGISALILGSFIVINVVLNLRLLRWYYLVKKSDVS